MATVANPTGLFRPIMDDYMDLTGDHSSQEGELANASGRHSSMRYFGHENMSSPEHMQRAAFSSPVRPYQSGQPGPEYFSERGRRTECENFHSSPSHLHSHYQSSMASTPMGSHRAAFPPPKMAEFPPPQHGFESLAPFYYGGSMPATLRELTETSVADEWEASAKAIDMTFATPSMTEYSSPTKGSSNDDLTYVPFSTEPAGRDGPSHWIVLRGVDPGEVRSGAAVETLRQRSGMFENIPDFVVGDVLYFEIDGLKTAPFARATVKLVNGAWSAEYVSKEAIAGPGAFRDGVDGQLRATVILIENNGDQYDISQRSGTDRVLAQLCKYFNQTWGEVRAAQMIHFDLANRVIMFRLEFDSLAACRNLLKECRGKILLTEGLSFEVDVWKLSSNGTLPDDGKHGRRSIGSDSDGGKGGTWFSNQASSDGSERSMVISSPARHRMACIESPAMPHGRSGSPMGPGASHCSQQSNTVSKDRILSGLDVRTTIMLRNIPNRIDVHQFKAFLDRTSFGRYDFSYLRIDFQTNSNVGYAFINFIDANSIIPFADAVSGRQWAEWGSQKTAQISYATIQGRDCLIQKFRNSSVMRELSEHRPKLWYSLASPGIHHALVGTEEPFPPPDNHAKLQRSIDNAAHQGLYPPRSGDTFDDRSRRGNWDRGTLHELAERLMYFAEMKYGRAR